MSKPVYTPEAAMQLAAQKIANGERVAVLFGPERAGLENEDISRANVIISVPVNPDFPSLNLAQCVLLVGYEWMRQQSEQAPVVENLAGTDWADNSEIEHLAKHYEERMEEAGFFYPEHKAASMKVNLRNMWSRLALTRADVQIFHGTLRQMVRWKERG